MIFARGLAEIANRSAPARFGAFSLLPRVWLRISDELPRPVEVAASVAERLARVVLRQARELGEEDIARARRFRLGHGRSGLLLRRQKRLARWASHAGPAMMYTSSVLRLLMEGRARRVLGCPSRRGDSIRQSMQLRKPLRKVRGPRPSSSWPAARRGKRRGGPTPKQKTLPLCPPPRNIGGAGGGIQIKQERARHRRRTLRDRSINRARPTAPARRAAPGAP